MQISLIGQLRFILAMRGITPDFGSYDGEDFREEDFERQLTDDSSMAITTCFYRIRKVQARFLAHDYAAAVALSDAAEQVLWTSRTYFVFADYHFYSALARAAFHDMVPDEVQPRLREDIAKHHAQLEILALNSPDNFTNSAALVGAEIARIEKRDQDAMGLYEKAITSARENGFVQNEAVAYEVAASFYRQRGYYKFARTYLAEAAACYARWGAAGKVRQLERLHPWLAPAGLTEAATLSEHLDAVSLFKAQQAISGEILMDRLAQTLMSIVMENAGAQKGCLFVEGGSNLLAMMTPGDEHATRIVFDFAMVETNIPETIVNYVRRSRETVILNDASTDAGIFLSDEYLFRVKPKSVLCMAIQRKDRLLAVLYLENNLVVGVFTHERRIIIELLASQAAISLETSGLYEALKESELKYRRIVDNAAEGIWALGPDTMTISVNSRMAEMLCSQAEEMIGKPVTAYIFEEDWPDHHNKMENRRRGISEHYQRRFLRKDGKTVWTLVSAIPVFDDDHHFEGSCAMITDITELKQAEDTSRKSEALLNAAQQLAKIGGWEYDVKSGKSFWTDELYQIHEIPKDPNIDHLSESSKCYRPEDRPVILEAFQKACDKGEPYDLEFPFTTFKGRHLWIRITAQPVFEEGKVARLIGNVMDITERKLAEETLVKLKNDLELRVQERTAELQSRRDELKESQMALMNIVEDLNEKTAALEVVNKELEAFSYSVSHDLRAPLRGIDGFSQILFEEYRDKFDSQGKEYLQRIRSAAQRMAQLIDDMLSLSRISRSEMKVQEANLSEMAQEIYNNLSAGQPERHNEFIIKEGINAMVDTRLFRIVLENLIGNAWKFSSKKDKARIEFGIQEQKGRPVYFIRDNGAGFDMKYSQKLFGAFQRLHANTEFPGTGIGLATVQRIIHRHGGRIWAEGEVEKGATFYFLIP